MWTVGGRFRRGKLPLSGGVLSVIFDIRTMRAHGVGWQALLAVYQVDQGREAWKLVGPVVLAIIAISGALSTGDGLDVLESVAGGFGALFPQR